MRFTVTDHNQFGTGVRYLLKFVAQLRDLLAAKQSAEVANKHQNRGLFLPRIFQGKRVALGGQDRSRAKFLKKGHHVLVSYEVKPIVTPMVVSLGECVKYPAMKGINF